MRSLTCAADSSATASSTPLPSAIGGAMTLAVPVLRPPQLVALPRNAVVLCPADPGLGRFLPQHVRGPDRHPARAILLKCRS